MIRLLELRTELRLSQREIAGRLNISQGTYNNWENSKTQPSIEQLIELSKLFKVSVDFLIGNSDDYGVINVAEYLSKEQQQLLQLYGKLDETTKKAFTVLLLNMNR